MNIEGLLNDENLPAVPEDLPKWDGSSITTPKVGVFDGTLDAMADILPNAALMTGSAATSVISQAGIESAAIEAQEIGVPIEDPTTFAKEQAERTAAVAKEWRRKAKEDYSPDPETTGVVAQVIHGVGTEITKGVMATLVTGGNAGAASLLYGAQHGIETAQRYKDQGVDENTAASLGVGAFVAGMLGMRLPAALGSTRAVSALYGSVVNPLANVSEDATIRTILDKAGYAALADKVDPFDPVNLAVAAVVGGGFGALGYRARPDTELQEAVAKADAADNAKAAAEAPAVDAKQKPVSEAVSKALNNSIVNANVDAIREASALRVSSAGVVLQNRDRNTAKSIMQMQRIAANPVYTMVSVSRDFAQGAPAIGYAEIPEAQYGRYERVAASDGTMMEMRYAVIEADQVQTSNFVDGSRNPDYGTEARNIAIAGNGRIAGIAEAYRRGTADKYKADLVADADTVGIPKEVIEKMQAPVLVRVMSDKDAGRADVAALSNETGTAGFDAAEQAENDAAAIDLAQLTFDEEGNITSETIQQFAALVKDPSMIVDKAGRPNVFARPRLERAIFQRVFGDANLTGMLTDEGSSGKRVVQILMRAAPKLMQLEGSPLDFRDDLKAAVNAITTAKASGQFSSIDEVARQIEKGRTPETTAFLDYFATVGGNKINEPAKVFSDLADWVTANRESQTGLFADETPEATRVDLMMQFSQMTGVPVDPKLLDMIQQEVTHSQKVQQVHKTIADQLRASGQPEEQIEAQATLWTNATMRLAEQAHVAPMEILPKIKVADQADAAGFASVEHIGMMQRSRQFDEVLKLWKKGQGPRSFTIGRPSWVLQIFGTSTKPLYATRSGFVHVLQDEETRMFGEKGKHDISPEELQGLLVAIQNPVAVFRSRTAKDGENSIVLATELRREGQNIIVPVHISVEKNGEVKIKNKIPTAYEKKSFETWINEGLLLGYDAEKGPLIVPSDHRSNSRRSVGVSGQTPLPNGTKKNPLPVPIVYRNPTSVGDLYQVAWHGSPHQFDRFSTEHIGSGEGAQMHGWGLYFAEDQAVADRYRGSLVIGRGENEYSISYKGARPEELPPSLRVGLERLKGNVLHIDSDIRREYESLVYSLNERFEAADRIAKVYEGLIAQIDENPKQSISSFLERVPGDEKYRADLAVKSARAAAKNEGRRASVNDVRTQLNDSLAAVDQQRRENKEPLDALRQIDPEDLTVEYDSGRVFKVDIPDPDKMLDEQKLWGAGSNFELKAKIRGMIREWNMEHLDTDQMIYVPDSPTGRDVYQAISKAMGGPKQASLWLKNRGIEGITYVGGTDGRCYVVFDDQAIEVLDFYQRQSGEALGSYSPAENRITLTPNANITTLSHEMGHFWLANAIEFSKSNRTDMSLRQDVRKLFDIWGIKDQAYWDDLGVEGQRKYHEQFASWVEEYLSTGKVPAPTLQSLFEKFRTWITSLYRDMRAHLEGRYRSEFGEELPPLSKEVRDILDRNLAYEDAMRAARSDFSVTHAQADSARYANFERIKRQDQMTDQSDEQQTQASLFEEFKAADAINSGQKVEVSAPVDVDRMAGQKRIVEERLGFPETIAPKMQPEGMPVYETPQIQGLDQVPLELPSGSSPEEVAAAREGAEIVKESPNMAVVTADGESRTALQFMQETEQQAREVEAFSETLNKAAQCIVNNGGI